MDDRGCTVTTASATIGLPDWAWERVEVREALRARNISAVFRHVQQYSGASQARIASATGMTQSRVNEIINGRREVTRLDVYERIADGLHMPDSARHLLGLAAGRERHSGDGTFTLATFPEVVRVYARGARARVGHPRGTRSGTDRPEPQSPALLVPSAGPGRSGTPGARGTARSRQPDPAPGSGCRDRAVPRAPGVPDRPGPAEGTRSAGGFRPISP
ncbi:helix-turn-helix domain-containing protein, partial [Streptomyces flavofungini]|uniref:helix-turn-helix domain-containing protein n=1 Tax=Streptomyces flavofungini TaxID=68200 RepID=UPI0034DEF8C2